MTKSMARQGKLVKKYTAFKKSFAPRLMPFLNLKIIKFQNNIRKYVHTLEFKKRPFPTKKFRFKNHAP